MSVLDKYMPLDSTQPMPRPGGGSVLDRYMPAIVEEEDDDTNAIVSFGAGVARGILEPFGILPPIHAINEKLKQYAGNDVSSKIGYGLGFVGGLFVPGAIHYKIGGKVAGAVLGAEKAAEMTWRARAIQGATAGALYGAGMHSEDPAEWGKHVLSTAALGGAGDVVLPAAWSAVAARFGSKANKKIVELLEAAEDEMAESVGTAVVTPRVRELSDEAVRAHAQAMQLVDDIVRVPKRTVADQQAIDAMKARGLPTPIPDAEATSFAAKRLNIKNGIEQLPWVDLRPGTYRIVPTPHGDADDLVKILSRTEGLTSRRVKDSVLLSVGSEIDDRIVTEFEKYGFMRGQRALYRGTEWMALKPAKNGVMLQQAGRTSKPVYAKLEDVGWLPIVDDISRPANARIGHIGPLAAEFIGKNSLWPSTQAPQGVSGLIAESQSSFRKAFDTFTTEKSIFGRDRIRLHNHLVELQRRALATHDPELGETIKLLEAQSRGFFGKPHPDGTLHQMAYSRGLVPVQELGKKNQKLWIMKNASGQAVSPPLNKKQSMEWLRTYGGQADDLAEGLSIADGVIPPTGGATVPPHTGGESPSLPEFNASAGLSLMHNIMPRIKYFQAAEDAMISGGPVKPFTGVALPISRAKVAFRNEEMAWLRGDSNTPGLLKVFNKSVRSDKREALFDLMESPRAEWQEKATELELNAGELQAAQKFREWFNTFFERHIKDPNIDITADDFLENYMPHYRAKSDAEAYASLSMSLSRKGREVNKVAAEFASEMTRKGTLKKYEKDPFQAAVGYMRSGLYKSYMKSVINDAVEQVNKMPVRNPDEDLLKRSLINYVTLNAYGMPEVLPALERFAQHMSRSLKLELDGATSTKLVNTLLAMNYGAYMGFRPGLVLRNLTQTLVTTYPILGGRYTGYGFRMALKGKYDDAMREVHEAGALVGGHNPAFGEDMIYAGAQSLGSAKNVAGAAVDKAGKAAAWATEKGLTLFQKADDFNRTVAYFGQKRKLLDAWNKYNGELTESFFRESGLNYYGESVKQLFKQQGFTSGEEAGKWLGVFAAQDTQWLYQLGAGPAMFSVGIGRIAGQYGTWPTWYGSYLVQGAKNLQGVERAAFAARNLAVHAAFGIASATTAMNFSRWTGLSSFNWMGGPAVDWFSDFRSIWSGVTASGESTAERDMALARRGMSDDGSGLGGIMPSALGGRVEVTDPRLLASSFFGAFTPGYLAYKDVMRARESLAQTSDGWTATAKLLNLPMDATGHEWPQVNIR